MYDSPEVKAEHLLRSSMAGGALSCSKARYYKPNIGRFISEDPIFNLDFGIEIEGSKSEPVIRDEHAYLYARNMVIRFVDPLGLRKCESGRCPDCPGGKWLFEEGGGSAFLWYGVKGGKARAHCTSSGVDCTYVYYCGSVGMGFDWGLSVGAGAALGNCQCAEDLAGTVVSIEGGAALNAEFSPGPSKCLTFAGGAGIPGTGATLALKVNACKYIKTGCN